MTARVSGCGQRGLGIIRPNAGRGVTWVACACAAPLLALMLTVAAGHAHLTRFLDQAGRDALSRPARSALGNGAFRFSASDASLSLVAESRGPPRADP